VDFNKFTTALLAATTTDAVKKLVGSIDKKECELADKDQMYSEAITRYLSLEGPEVQWAKTKIDTLLQTTVITKATHEKLVAKVAEIEVVAV
jgi:hypothetical protein